MATTRLFHHCFAGCKIADKPDVACNAWCANHYHQQCVNISAHRAEATNWVCNMCKDVTRNLEGSVGSVTSQDLMEISSQELIPLQADAINILQDRPSDNLPSTSENARLNEHLALMTMAIDAQQPASSRNIAQEPDPEQTPQGATDTANERASQVSSSTETYSQDETEYVIEKIVKHHVYSKDDIWYWTKWDNYPEKDNLWLPESAFTHAFDILEEYKSAKKLGKPTIFAPTKRRYGAIDQTVQVNRDNWNTVERVIKVIKGFSHNYYRNALPITFLEKGQTPEEFNQVCLIEYQSTHVVTGLFKVSNRILYVADGLNCCFEEKAQRYFAKWNVNLIPIRFDHQTGVDHCSSSAAAIAIEFLKHFARINEVIVDTIIVPRTQLEAIKKALHKSKSVAIKPHMSGRDNVPIYRCPAENCDFKSSERSRRKIAMHQIRQHGAYKPM